MNATRAQARPSRTTQLVWAFTLLACSGGGEAPSQATPTPSLSPVATSVPEPARAEPPRTTPAPTSETHPETTPAPTTETPPPREEVVWQSPWPVSGARLLDDCLWYADTTTPPLEGAGSMAELDERIGGQLTRTARVVGRLRLTARGCVRLSVGIALAGRADGDDPLADISVLGWDRVAPPVPGARGDERRNAPFDATAGLDTGTSECEVPASLHVFRAIHGPDGAVQELAVQELGEACTLFAHDLEHGDFDRDGTSELRVRVRASGLMDMSAGAQRRDELRIFDLASLATQVVLTLGVLEANEVDGYGRTDTRGEIAIRDLDDDGDRDIVLRSRGSSSERSVDDMDEITHGVFVSEAYAYDAAHDVWLRARELDARIPGAHEP